jgi:mannosyltransferase OCH1-like enzyme
MIPRIIHQCWFGDKSAPFENMATWQKLNPSFEYKLWRDWDMPLLLSNLDKWQQINTWNGKSDVARFEMLERFGGIYIDADTVALRPLTDDLLDNEFFAVYESETVRPGLVASGIMGAELGNTLIKKLVAGITFMRDMNEHPAWLQVGPGYLTQTIKGYVGKVKIYPSAYFLPQHYTGALAKADREPYCSHSWGTTTQSYEQVAA